MIEPLDHKINETNKQLFIKHSADDVQEAVITLLNSIMHISYKTFIEQIEKNLKEVISYRPEDRPIFIYIKPYKKNKSSFYMYLLIEKIFSYEYIGIKLKPTANFSEVLENDIVLFADDCVYSGIQMYDTIDEVLKGLNNNIIKKQIKFILFFPYISEKGMERILRAFTQNLIDENNLIKINYIKILPLSKYLTMKDAKNLFKYYNIKNDNTVKDELSKYLIYFDHKLADFVSTLPYIFNGYVPNQHNLDILDKHDQNDSKYRDKIITKEEYDDNKKKILENFVQFPLITYCESIEKKHQYINENELCPVPPYKEEYNDFRVKVTAEKAEEEEKQKQKKAEEKQKKAAEDKAEEEKDKATEDKAAADKAAEDKTEADKTEEQRKEQRKAEEKAAKLFKKLLIKTPIQSLDKLNKLNNLLYQYFNMTK
jgi:hypothetical protein